MFKYEQEYANKNKQLRKNQFISIKYARGQAEKKDHTY